MCWETTTIILEYPERGSQSVSWGAAGVMELCLLPLVLALLVLLSHIDLFVFSFIRSYTVFIHYCSLETTPARDPVRVVDVVCVVSGPVGFHHLPQQPTIAWQAAP